MRQEKHQLYGLRAYAIAIVVASHCQLFKQGGVGNAIMFCLSGFLAVKPFSDEMLDFHSVKDVAVYYKKKCLNILPAYYFCILAIKLLTDERIFTWRKVAECAVFYRVPGHFWFLQQIMLMYFLTPMIVYCFNRTAGLVQSETGKSIWLMVLSGLLAFVSRKYIGVKVFSLYANDSVQEFRLYQYMIGMAFGYLYSYIIRSHLEERLSCKAARIIIPCLILLLSILPIVSSNRYLALLDPGLIEYFVGWKRPVLCTFLSGVLIVLLLVDDRSFITGIYKNHVLGILGKASYEIYILHWYFLSPMKLSSHNYKNFLLVYLVTACVGCGIHKYVVPIIQDPRKTWLALKNRDAWS